MGRHPRARPPAASHRPLEQLVWSVQRESAGRDRRRSSRWRRRAGLRVLAPCPRPRSAAFDGADRGPRLQFGRRECRAGGADRAGARARRAQRAGRLAHAHRALPAPDEALLAVHTAAYLDRLRVACAGGPWDGEYAPVTRGHLGGGPADRRRRAGRRRRGPRRRGPAGARPRSSGRAPCRARPGDRVDVSEQRGVRGRARPRPGVERVAIIDWDVHVANGAERIFWDRDDVLAISLHQQDWYPAHAGALRAKGGSGAEGSTVNVPLPPATTDAGYLLAFDEIVAPILRAFRPELIMVAAGQDASVFDPTGRMLVSAAGFRDARRARRVSRRRAHRRAAGGQHRRRLQPDLQPVLLPRRPRRARRRERRIADPWHDDATVRAARAAPDDRVRAAIAAVRSAQPRWFT